MRDFGVLLSHLNDDLSKRSATEVLICLYRIVKRINAINDRLDLVFVNKKVHPLERLPMPDSDATDRSLHRCFCLQLEMQHEVTDSDVLKRTDRLRRCSFIRTTERGNN